MPTSAKHKKYNASPKGKARSKRYNEKLEVRQKHREHERSIYLKKKSEGICAKNGCSDEADAGVYCSDHRRYMTQMDYDSRWRTGR